MSKGIDGKMMGIGSCVYGDYNNDGNIIPYKIIEKVDGYGEQLILVSVPHTSLGKIKMDSQELFWSPWSYIDYYKSINNGNVPTKSIKYVHQYLDMGIDGVDSNDNKYSFMDLWRWIVGIFDKIAKTA